jgi:hypothetical protein
MRLEQRDELRTTVERLRTRYRELQEHFVALRQGYFMIQCAWCRRRLGWKRKHAAVSGETSHSICARCAAAMVRAMARPPDPLRQAAS